MIVSGPRLFPPAKHKLMLCRHLLNECVFVFTSAILTMKFHRILITAEYLHTLSSLSSYLYMYCNT